MNVLYVWELPYQVGHLVFDVFAEDARASEHNCVVNSHHRFSHARQRNSERQAGPAASISRAILSCNAAYFSKRRP